jgi:hypothetical protein
MSHQAEKRDFEGEARAAQAMAAQALGRLLHLAQTLDSGQVRRVARFIAALYDGEAFPLDLFELRAVDARISDDVLACIDALRWGRADLFKLVPDGQERIEAVIRDWGVARPEPPMPPDAAELSARLVNCGNALGYRSVSLTFDCEAITARARGPAIRMALHLDAASSAAVAQHIIGVHRLAWSRPYERPLDAADSEVAPQWAR